MPSPRCCCAERSHRLPGGRPPLARLLLLVVGWLAVGCAAAEHFQLPPPQQRPQPGDLTEPMLRVDGGTATLADFVGEVVLVHFFSTDCLPCLQEIPMLVRLQRELEGEGFEVVGISLDLQGALPVQLLQERYGISYPLLLASERMFHRETPFGPLLGLPMSVLLDRQGKVAGWVLGLIDEERLRAATAGLLLEPGGDRGVSVSSGR